MDITNFDDLLLAARGEPEPQRLLFVFAGAELRAGATAAQRAQFDAGEGGELAPLMCVDRSAAELSGFSALAAEAALAGPPWAIVFTAALSGRYGIAPTSVDAEAPLQHMVDSIKAGRLDGMLPFDRHGDPVQFA
ncbi:MAG: ribonucleotide reductase subunit alpha [Betaproteobacteria bacterium]